MSAAVQRTMTRATVVWRLLAGVAVVTPFLMAAAGQAPATVVVSLTLPAIAGEVGCALFPSADGFPNEPDKVRGVRVTAAGTTATCTFDEVAPGTYAVAAFLDTNGNRVSDRNVVGMPTEPWGVSNGVRPRFRAPRFDEAAFAVAAAQRVAIDVALVK